MKVQHTDLGNGCVITHLDDLKFKPGDGWAWAQAIGRGDRAEALSLFCIRVARGSTPPILAGDSEVVLYVLEGTCTLRVGDRQFDCSAGSGAHVHPGESFSLITASNQETLVLASFCPQCQGLTLAESPAGEFNERYPVRTVEPSQARAETTGDREFRLLAGPSTGPGRVTQFLGRIPRSRAPEHHHLYEEAICILSGQGRMWTGTQSAPVRPGSLIFLPRKQPHCLQCDSPEGMELMGVFYPAGSPAVSYA